MSTANQYPTAIDWEDAAKWSLRASSVLWFVVAVAGQWTFVAYIALFYGGSALLGNFDAWNETIPNGYVPGQPVGNLAAATHIAMAVLIMGGGPLQLIPRLRAALPRFHRWNGRIYVATVSLTSLVGLFMVWVRGARGGLAQHLGISLDAILILVFAALAVRRAREYDYWTHRQWALRLFMVASAVWFYRVGLMAWLELTGGVGIDFATFSGPFLVFWAFAQYLLPLAFLQAFFWAEDRGEVVGRLVVATGIVVATLVMLLGIFEASNRLWLPRIQPPVAEAQTTAHTLRPPAVRSSIRKETEERETIHARGRI